MIAALDPLDARDRRRVKRITGEAIEAVSGKDGDAAARDAALKRGARRASAPSRLTETTSLIALARTTRSTPARSRPRLDLGEPGAPQQLRDRARLALADLQRHRAGDRAPRLTLARLGRARSWARRARIALEPVGAGEQRLARLPLA